MLFMFRGFHSPDEGIGGGELPTKDVTTEENVETGEEVEEAAEPLTEEGAEEQETAEPAEDNKSDAAFAQMRRDLEAAQRRADELEEALGLWFDGDNKAAQAHAHYEDIPLEEAISNIEQKRAYDKLQAEKEALEERLQKLEFENLKASDLKEIKAKHPEADLKDVEELGEEFFKYRAMGNDANSVYEAIQIKKGVPPKPMGKVKTGTPTSTGYFTREEVANMSKAQIKKNFDKIRESMSKW